jgi:CubicO group peptidase (beta-lactamase class C family)
MTMLDLAADRRQFIAALAAAAAMPSAAFGKGAAGHPAIRALVDHYVAEKKVANIVVAVGGRKGPPDFISAGQLELGRGADAGPDSLYRIYSMTKPVTGCAIMMLVEQGRLTLDTPLGDIFPAFRDMTVLTDPRNSLATRPATRPILVRHLLTHSAGFAYGSTAPAPLARLYAEKGVETASAAAGGNPFRPPNLAAFATTAASLPLMFEPGSKWNYSIGLDIAGAVVEKLSGIPFDDFLEQRLFKPLGMKDTAFSAPADKLDRLTAMYKYTLTGLEVIDTAQTSVFAHDPAIPSGGGGLVSSARDYAQFMAMLLDEGQLGRVRILKPATARMMMSNLMEPGVLATTATGDYGFGAGGRSVIKATPGGEGIGTFGWTGAANSIAWVDRANGVYIVLMTQVRAWPQNSIYQEFGKALYVDQA